MTEGQSESALLQIIRGPDDLRLANPVTLKIVPLNVSAAIQMNIGTDQMTIQSINRAGK